MSLDLMVFDSDVPPKGKEEFIAWYNEQMDLDAGDDPSVTAPALKYWFMEIIQSFPPLNGPLSPKELPEDDEIYSDYSIGESIIYVNFRWSLVEDALEKVYSLAARHEVGFFYVSSDLSEIFYPINGVLALVHSDANENA